MTVDRINELAKNAPAEFVRRCDEGLDAQIKSAAKRIAGNMENSRIVLLSGPSGSGKTTTALKTVEALLAFDIHAHVVHMDNYFIDVDPEKSPRTEDGKPDFESPECLDMELLGRHFEIISEGGEIDIPKFDFRRQKRSPQIYERLRLTGREVMIVEGIHAHNPQIIGHQPKAVRIFVSTSPNARLVRRMIRDNNFRGASASYTYSLWANVRKNEEENILPLRPNADIDIDTTLLYEPGVLKPFVEDLFSRPETDGNFRKAREDILAEFSKYEAIPEKYLPPTSLLREFIGGSSYKY